MDIFQILFILGMGGALVGLLSGLLGVGGAFLIVPLLNLFFEDIGVPHEMIQHLAVGTAPSCMLVTSATSFIAHTRMGSMRWDVWKTMLPGILAGAVGGSFLANMLDGRILEILFGMIIVVMSTQIFLDRKPQPNERIKNFYVPVSVAVGMLSSMTGVAGSMQIIVFLAWAGHEWCDCVSTAAALTLPIMVTSTISYMLLGWNVPYLPEFSLGYVYLPGTCALMVPGIIMAVAGAKIAHWSGLPLKVLKRAFAVLGWGIGGSVLIKVIFH